MVPNGHYELQHSTGTGLGQRIIHDYMQCVKKRRVHKLTAVNQDSFATVQKGAEQVQRALVH